MAKPKPNPVVARTPALPLSLLLFLTPFATAQLGRSVIPSVRLSLSPIDWYLMLWPMAAAASLTLALVHIRVWLGRRDEWASLLFSVAATATAIVALIELTSARAETTAQFATIVRWSFIPFWVLLVSLIEFVRLYLGTGRRWLELVSIGLWTLTVILNFLLPPGQSLTYEMVTGLRPVIIGGETFVVAEGVPNPWNVVTYLGVLFMLAFVVDASIALWRQGGHRRRALVVGGSVSFFFLLSGVHSALVEAHLIQSPYIVSFCFLAIIFAMGGELSQDLLHSAELSRQLLRSEAELRESEQRLTLAADSAGAGFWSMNFNTKRFWVSSKMHELFQVAPAEGLTRDSFLKVIHPEDREAVHKSMEHFLKINAPFVVEYRVMLPDGSLRWISARGRPHFTASGQLDGTMGVAVDITERKEAEAALIELSGRLIGGQEEERSRLARELHDDFTQRLAMLTGNLEKAALVVPTEPEKAVEQLHKLWDQTSEIGADLHKLSHNLHSSVLDILGLVEGVRSLCEDFAAQQEVQVDFTSHDVPSTIPASTALCLFRIAQEALANVKKHSGTSSASVQLTGNGKEIELSISDAGVGFDEGNLGIKTGLGFRSMQERLRIVSGTIEVKSQPGAGTQILIRVPLPDSAIAA